MHTVTQVSFTETGKLAFAEVHFAEQAKPSVIVPTLDMRSEANPGFAWFLGLGTVPIAYEPAELPGISLSAAAIRAASPELRRSLVKRVGEPLDQPELFVLTAPVVNRAMRQEIILAGIRSPIDLDPRYERFAPLALNFWRFVPGADRAEPLAAGATTFLNIRVFNSAEWRAVERAGGKLISSNADTAAIIDHVSTKPSQSVVTAWVLDFLRNRTSRPPKQDEVIEAARKATGATKRQVQAAYAERETGVGLSRGRPRLTSP